MAQKSEMPINPDVLKWARESLNLEIDEAAKSIGVSAETLEAWESGSKMPSFPQLKKIGNTYKRATAVFFFADVPKDPRLPKDYRVLNEEAAPKLAPSTLIAIRGVQRKRLQAIELAEMLGEGVPNFEWRASTNQDPEELATHWRKKFGLTYELQASFKDEYKAFSFWRKSIENLGVLVFQASLESIEELRGLAIYDRKFPAILLNSKDTVKGRIFSLLHEFSHLLLHTSGIGNMSANASRHSGINEIEVFCNAFAAACLVPKENFLSEPEVMDLGSRGQISDKEIRSLVGRYQASWEVVLRRLLTFKKISVSYYRSRRSELKEINERLAKKEGGFVPWDTRALSYNGEPFTRLVVANFNAGNITVPDVSSYLGVGVKHLGGIEQILRGKRGA